MTVKFNEYICKFCGSCSSVCPSKSIIMEDNKIYTNKDCIDCYKCIIVCPCGAISKL